MIHIKNSQISAQITHVGGQLLRFVDFFTANTQDQWSQGIVSLYFCVSDLLCLAPQPNKQITVAHEPVNHLSCQNIKKAAKNIKKAAMRTKKAAKVIKKADRQIKKGTKYDWVMTKLIFLPNIVIHKVIQN